MFEDLKSKTKDWNKYSPGKCIQEIAQRYNFQPEQVIKLGSNENPFGCSPKVDRAIESFLKNKKDNLDGFNIYPSAIGQELVRSLKERFTSNQRSIEISVGNGMDSIIESITRLILSPGKQSLIITPTFEYYKIASLWAGAQPVFLKAQAKHDFSVSSQEIINTLQENQKIKLLFLCNPNNPTGYFWEREKLKEILDYTLEHKIWVFLDEAYTEYLDFDSSLINWIPQYQNLIIGRTFSKIHGLAALRVGWTAFHQSLLEFYQKVQVPFDNNKIGLIAAQESLKDQGFLSQATRINQQERTKLIYNLNELGFKVFSSQGNFVSLLAGEGFSCSAEKLTEQLLKSGIIVRNASKFLDAPNDLVRITIGTPQQNKRLISCLARHC